MQGADINALDKESRSPLLLAASRSGWRTVASLIRLGADVQVKDSSKRNVLHLIVMYGGRLDEFAHEITMVVVLSFVTYDNNNNNIGNNTYENAHIMIPNKVLFIFDKMPSFQKASNYKSFSWL